MGCPILFARFSERIGWDEKGYGVPHPIPLAQRANRVGPHHSIPAFHLTPSQTRSRREQDGGRHSDRNPGEIADRVSPSPVGTPETLAGCGKTRARVCFEGARLQPCRKGPFFLIFLAGFSPREAALVESFSAACLELAFLESSCRSILRTCYPRRMPPSLIRLARNIAACRSPGGPHLQHVRRVPRHAPRYIAHPPLFQQTEN